MLKKILILSTLILFFVNSFSQSLNIYNDISEKQSVVEYSDTELNSINNKIIKQLSQSIPSPLQDTKLSFSYLLGSSINQKVTKILLKADISKIKLVGTFQYKGFIINDVLYPNKIDFKFKWIDKNENLIKSKTLSDVVFKSGKKIVNLSFIDTNNVKGSKIEISDISLVFDENNEEKFNLKLNTIDSYYDSDVRIKIANQNLDKINLDSLNLLNDYLRLIDETHQTIKNIKSLRLVSKLSLQTNDPITLMSKLSKLKLRNEKLKKDIQHVLKNMHEAYYKKGVYYLSVKNPLEAEKYFNKSLEVKKNYPPSLYQLAKIDFGNKKYEKSLTTLSMVLNTLKPKTDTRYDCVKLSEEIIKIYIADAKQLTDDKDFENAFRVLEKCTNICDSINGLNCTKPIEIEYKHAHHGKYQNIIDETEIKISNGDLSQAEKLIDSAQVYQKNYRKYIINDEALFIVYNKLYDAYYAQGSSLNKEKKYEEAFNNLKKSKVICTDYYAVECSEGLSVQIEISVKGIYKNMILSAQQIFDSNDVDSAYQIIQKAEKYRAFYNLDKDDHFDILLAKINHKQYLNLIAQGIKFYENEKSEKALNNFKQAQKIEEKYSYEHNKSLDTLIHKSARMLLLHRIRQGEKEVLKNNLFEARKFSSTAKTIQENYKVENDTIIQQRFEELNNKIFSKDCKNSQLKYNVQFNSALHFIEKKNFIEADNALNKAIKISNENSVCHIITINALNKKQEISPVIKYQKMMLGIDKLIDENSYQGAIKEYLTAEKFFAENNISKFGLEIETLFNFIKNNETLNFVNFAVKYYTNNNNYDNALILLNNLSAKGYERSWAKNNQTLLGTQLAIRDFNAKPEANYKTKLIKYTKNNKWYNSLKKAYIKQWKNLKK
ncbi:MAG: hypothetical protein DRJ01_04880 [Bacteroidetes bacterium]|nr:MAG: hypothetical protein DRJ01_04880 [Bacteroidota bacterium]